MTLKDTNAIFIASLIATMTIPVTGNIADVEAQTADIEKLTAYEEWIWKNMDGLPDKQKTNTMSEFRAFIGTLDGYDALVFEKVSDIAEVQKQLDSTSDAGDSKSLEMKLAALLFDLEEYGVTTQDRYDQNPEYWKARAIEAKIRAESPGTGQVTYIGNDQNIHHVHQTDLALKRTALLTVPIFSGEKNGIPYTIPYLVISWGWNAGSNTSSRIQVQNGEVTFEGSVCLDQPTHHNSVDFSMTIEKKIQHLILWWINDSKIITTDATHNEQGDCEVNTSVETILAGYYISFTTTISDIELN